MMMVSKKSSQVWLLFIFAVLALCSYNTERVSANDFCPEGDLEIAKIGSLCYSVDTYKNCPQWCRDNGKTFNKRISLPSGIFYTFNCVCCCRDPEPAPPPPPPPPPPIIDDHCPPGDIEGTWSAAVCKLEIHYRNCQRWCQDQDATFDKKFIIDRAGLFNFDKCVCCCRQPEPVPPPPPPPNKNKWCRPSEIERIWVTNICGFNKEFEDCGNWCRTKGRSFESKYFARPKPDYGLVDCVCCCTDPLPPPSSTGSSLSIAAQ